MMVRIGKVATDLNWRWLVSRLTWFAHLFLKWLHVQVLHLHLYANMKNATERRRIIIEVTEIFVIPDDMLPRPCPVVRGPMEKN